MFNPKVTIVIPVYNGAFYVGHAIECALNQTYPNIEILVVNDGSTDNGETEKAVQRYGDKIRYIKKENGGVSSALNLAIEQMEGEWFSWLSHDDGYYPDKIKRQISQIDRLATEKGYKREEIVIYGENERIDKDGNVILHRKRNIDNDAENVDVIIRNISDYTICGCAVLVHRSALQKIGGFNEAIRTVSDAECFFRLLLAGYHFYFIQDVLVQSRQHRQQVGKTKAELFARETDELHVWLIQQILEHQEWITEERLGAILYGVVKRNLPMAKQTVLQAINDIYGKKATRRATGLMMVAKMKGSIRIAMRKIYRRFVVK